MVSAIQRIRGIATLGLLTLASACAWAGSVPGTCVAATTSAKAPSTAGMRAIDAGDSPPAAFSIRDRMLLAEYRMLQRDRAPVLLALDPACTAAAAQALDRTGAQVSGRRDAIGYLRAWVPLDRLESIPALAGLQAVQVDALPVRASMGPVSKPAATANANAGTAPHSPALPVETAPSGLPPTPALLPDNPYTAESATQLLAFKARHPRYDGRGVTIGFVEPAARDLQTMHGALDRDGRPLPKFAAYEFVEPADLPTGFRFHANMVASVMAGSGFLGSRADGVAPAAQLAVFVPFAPGRRQGVDLPIVDGIEAILSMMADPRVDIGQASHSTGDTSRLGGTSPHALWIDRLIRQLGKPLVSAPGNYGASLLAMGEFPAAPEAFSIGAYTPAETWRANLGVATDGRHVLPAYAPYGPARDGGLKPDFLALTNTLAEFGEDVTPPWSYWQDDPGTGDPDLRGYGVSGGTSAAAPHAAGHIALLVGAARAAGIPHDVWRLRAAIASTAKFLLGVEARAQGYGLIQIEDAWEALQRARDWNPPTFSIQAPLVGAETRPEGPERFAGHGVFELSGWRPGQSGKRTVTLTRTGGDAGRNRYRLQWKGDTGVFASTLHDIDLPLGVPVTLPLDIAVGASGSYSAIVDLVDPQVNLVAGSVPMTVLVADPLPLDGTALHYRRESPRPGNSLFHVEVPPGTTALTVQVKRDATQAFSFWIAQDPTGRDLPFNPYGSELYAFDPETATQDVQQHTFHDPVPGVWQFRMQNQQPHSRETWASVPDWSAPMPLEVTIRGWRVASEATPAAGGRRIVFHGVGEGTSIHAIGVGATRTAQALLPLGLESTFFDVEIAAGTTRYEVELACDDPSALVGLYLYKEPEGERREQILRSDETALVGYDPSSRPRKRLVLVKPLPGRYRIAADPVRVPANGAKVTLRDTVFREEYGTIEVDNDLARPFEGEQTAFVRVRAQSGPPDGRTLLAEVGVFDDAGDGNAPPIATHAWVIEP